MGTVWRAREFLSGRLVALKLLDLPRLARAGRRRRRVARRHFRREAVLHARVSGHPNVVAFLAADPGAARPWIALELLEGAVTLGDLSLRHGPLPAGEACRYVIQAAHGLQHCATLGVVHRDVKPHNLVLTSDGRVKVIDFGIARSLRPADRDAPTLTDPGGGKGTLRFISREGLVDAHAASPATDVFGLGSVLHFLLTGEPPYPGDDLDDVRRRAERGETVRLEDYRNDVPPAVAAVLRKALRPDPARRPPTPRAFAAALEAALAPSRRLAHYALSLAAAVLFAAAGAGAAWYLARLWLG